MTKLQRARSAQDAGTGRGRAHSEVHELRGFLCPWLHLKREDRKASLRGPLVFSLGNNLNLAF